MIQIARQLGYHYMVKDLNEGLLPTYLLDLKLWSFRYHNLTIGMWVNNIPRIIN